MNVITGNPGTGKHTVARILVKKHRLEIVDVNRIAIDEGIAKKNTDAFDVDVKKLKKVLDKKMPENALLVGHLAPYVVSKNKVKYAIVLRRSPYSLERSYKKRRYTKKKTIENLGSEILGITYYDTIKNIGRKKTFQFDTTNRSITETVKRIELLFAKGKTREDSVDWLQIVSKKGDLKRFFPY
ncbi:MAG TPA: AAA family ATPase [Candidatus Nitrosotalea sp.]|nr:AAA family ATPase [Candidatus Nitrosotalea sp.]